MRWDRVTVQRATSDGIYSSLLGNCKEAPVCSSRESEGLKKRERDGLRGRRNMEGVKRQRKIKRYH